MSCIKVNLNSNLPKVVASGVLRIFNDLPCYVLDDGKRIVTLYRITYALRGKEHGSHGKIGNYLNSKVIKKYLPDRLIPLNDKENDRVPQGIVYFITDTEDKIEKGYKCEDFMEICEAFVSAKINGEKLSEAQKIMAYNANKFIMAAAKVGIIALVDEATGYQIYRMANELQYKLDYFLLKDSNNWQKVFPEELWYEFSRLTSNKKAISLRTKYWGAIINEIIYDKLDCDVIEFLKENKPINKKQPTFWKFVNEEPIFNRFYNHIWQVIGLAKTCNSIEELVDLVNKNFS